jgi:predicted lipoprotein
VNASRRFHRGWSVLGVALLVWLAVDQPWTVRPIGQPTAAAAPFDARAWVADIWTSRVLPHIETTAIPLDTLRDVASSGTTATRPSAVRLEGIITSVDTASRVGLALVDVLPVDGSPDAAIQIGPVLRGTALRDALDFIQFSDFTNQIEFAGVATALNERVLSHVLHAVDRATWQGRVVRVVGAASAPPRPGDLPLVVPVVLTMEALP